MEENEKRAAATTDIEKIQHSNKQWWTSQTMSYDWNDKVKNERFSEAWYEEIDRRFIHGARFFAHDQEPFDKIIPFDQLKGRSVLEIGCGMGLHSELIARSGATLTSIDISDTSVEATQRRLALRKVDATVIQMDARELDFPDASFDFVWSWGVIHHSAQTAQIIKEIARVLRPGGETRFMVYNLDGMDAYIVMVREYLVGFWKGRSLDECLWKRSDGFMARFYTKDMLGDILRLFFSSVDAQVFGQETSAVPLPRQLRPFVMKMISAEGLERRANARGSFLFMTARK